MKFQIIILDFHKILSFLIKQENITYVSSFFRDKSPSPVPASSSPFPTCSTFHQARERVTWNNVAPQRARRGEWSIFSEAGVWAKFAVSVSIRARHTHTHAYPVTPVTRSSFPRRSENGSSAGGYNYNSGEQVAVCLCANSRALSHGRDREVAREKSGRVGRKSRPLLRLDTRESVPVWVSYSSKSLGTTLSVQTRASYRGGPTRISETATLSDLSIDIQRMGATCFRFSRFFCSSTYSWNRFRHVLCWRTIDNVSFGSGNRRSFKHLKIYFFIVSV